MAQEKKHWAPEIETMPLDKLHRLQEEGLQRTVALAYKKSSFYRRKLDGAGIKPGHINALADLEKLPLTETLELRNTPSAEKLAIPWEQARYISSTSGTTAIPEPVVYTAHEYEELVNHFEPRMRWQWGIRPRDVVQILSGFECCRRGYSVLGATLLLEHAGRGNLDNQIWLAQRAGVTVLEYLPSLVLNYFERAKELGIDIRDSKIRLVVGVSEGWAEGYKKKVEEEYGVLFRSCYGSMEVGGVAAECEATVAGEQHVFGDWVILEIIDPQSGRVLPPGEQGEVVLTSLKNEAMPVIRYRTGDIATMLPYEVCSCSRTHSRISKLRGRAGDSI